MVKQNFLSGFFGNGGKTELTKINQVKINEDFDKIIEPYKKALNTMDEATARAQHLREASKEINEFVNSVNKENLTAEKYLAYQIKINAAAQSQSHSIRNRIAIIDEFNNSIEDGTENQEAFTDGIKDGDKHLGEYLKTVKKGEASFGGFIGKTLLGGLKNIGLNLLVNGVYAIVSGLITFGISKLNEGAHASERAGAVATQNAEKYEETATAISEYKTQVEDLRKSIDSGNLSESEAYEARKKLIEIQNDLIKKYGLERQGINLVTGAIDEQIEAIDRLGEREYRNYVADNPKAMRDLESYYSYADPVDYDAGKYGAVHNGMVVFSGDVWKKFISELSDNELDELRSFMMNEGTAVAFARDEGMGYRTQNIEKWNGKFSQVSNDRSFKSVNSAVEFYDSLISMLQNSDIYYKNETAALKLIEKINKEKSKFTDKLNSDYDKSSKNFETRALGELQYNKDYSDMWDGILLAEEKYRKALASGDESSVEEAVKNYNNVRSKFEKESGSWDSAVAREYASDFLNDLYELMRSDAVEVTVKTKFEESPDSQKSVTDALEIFKGSDGTIDTDKILNVGVNYEARQGEGTDVALSDEEKSYEKLKKVAEESEISVEDLIKALVSLGIIKPKVTIDTNAEEAKMGVDKLKTTLEEFQSLAKAYKEFSDDSISFSTIEKLREAFSTNSNISAYCDELYDAGTSAERVKEILTELTYAQLEAEYSTKALANASVTQVAAMLKEAGVANSVEVATYAIATAKERLKIAALEGIEATDEFVKNLDKEAVACGLTKAALIDLVVQEKIFNNSELSVDDKIEKLKEYATAAGITTEFLSRLIPEGSAFSEDVDSFDPVGYAKNKIHKKFATESDVNNAWDKTLAEISDKNKSVDYTPKDTSKAKTPAELLKEQLENLLSGKENAIKLINRWMNEAVDNNDYANVQKYSTDIVKIYREMQEEVHKTANKYREMGYDETSNEISELSEKWWSYQENIKNAMKQSFDSIVSNVRSSLDDIQNAYSTLKDAAEEYSEYGYITVDTFKSILDLGTEYLAFLVDENGQLKINEESINAVISARTQQLAIETSLNYIQSLRTALTENDIDSLNRLLYATDAATNSTWGFVYAQLAALNLGDDQYGAALERINTIRQLADTAITSIGQVNTSMSDTLDKWNDSLNSILDYVIDMIKQEVDNQVEALEKQIDDYKKIVDLQKESLRLAKEKDEYDSTVADKVKKIAKLQSQIVSLSLDDSREAKAEKAGLEEELADLQKELADYQADHAYEATTDSLDKQADAFEDEKNKEIDVLNDTISSQEKLYQLAISRIESQWDTLYSQLIAWNTQYGSDTNQKLTEAWNSASEAVQRYGSFVAALNTTSSAGTGGIGSVGLPSNIVSSRDNTQTVKYLVRQMRDNSDAWWASSDEGRARLDDQNKRLASQVEALIDEKLVRKDGVWYIGSVGGEKLYEKYKYHKGGIVGNDPNIKDNEVLSLLEKDEMVLDKSKKEGLYKLVDLRDKWGDAIDRLTESLFGKGTRIEMTGISDIASRAAKHLAGVNNNEVIQHVDASVVIHGDVDNDSWKKIYPALKEHQKEVARIVNSETVSRFHKVGVF